MLLSMRRLRLRRQRIALIGLLLCSLLWTQLVVAAHSVHCQPAASTTSSPCHGDAGKALADDQADAACQAHCQFDASGDGTRLLLPPPLPPAATAPTVCQRILLPVRATWPAALPRDHHGPTGHPASILLI